MPSWRTPEQGYVIIEPPKPKLKIKPRVRIVGEQIEINEKVMFALNSAEVDANSHGLLDEVATILAQNPQIERVRVEGHTDAQGDASANLKLSAARPRSARLPRAEGCRRDASRVGGSLQPAHGRRRHADLRGQPAGRVHSRAAPKIIIDRDAQYLLRMTARATDCQHETLVTYSLVSGGHIGALVRLPGPWAWCRCHQTCGVQCNGGGVLKSTAQRASASISVPSPLGWVYNPGKPTLRSG